MRGYHRLLAGSLAFLGVLSAAGCGAGMGKVSGKVTFNGKSIPTGRVTFIPDKGNPAVGVIEDGAYTVPQITPGPVKITVESSPPGLKIIVPGQPPPPKEDPAKATPFVPIPARYARPDQTDLRFTVQNGTQTHDIDLKP